jgi:AcrR family transcriptional regulator
MATPPPAGPPAEVQRTPHSPRARQIVDVARRLLDSEGPDGLTMRRLADEVGIRAPSLYNHFPDKAALESALIEEAMVEMGTALDGAVENPKEAPVHSLLGAYRRTAVAEPHLYRLATSGRLARDTLPVGLEEWAGSRFFAVTGDPHRSQALWSMAHGMVILEIDGRYPPDSDLDLTWRAAADAFDAP